MLCAPDIFGGKKMFQKRSAIIRVQKTLLLGVGSFFNTAIVEQHTLCQNWQKCLVLQDLLSLDYIESMFKTIAVLKKEPTPKSRRFLNFNYGTSLLKHFFSCKNNRRTEHGTCKLNIISYSITEYFFGSWDGKIPCSRLAISSTSLRAWIKHLTNWHS